MTPKCLDPRHLSGCSCTPTPATPPFSRTYVDTSACPTCSTHPSQDPTDGHLELYQATNGPHRHFLRYLAAPLNNNERSC